MPPTVVVTIIIVINYLPHCHQGSSGYCLCYHCCQARKPRTTAPLPLPTTIIFDQAASYWLSSLLSTTCPVIIKQAAAVSFASIAINQAGKGQTCRRRCQLLSLLSKQQSTGEDSCWSHPSKASSPLSTSHATTAMPQTPATVPLIIVVVDLLQLIPEMGLFLELASMSFQKNTFLEQHAFPEL
jgi:hypothetical protein